MSASEESWILKFCSLPENEFFCKVDESYVQNKLNLVGLSGQVPYYWQALDVILNVEPDRLNANDPLSVRIDQSAKIVYGLIHARYILTDKGMAQMLQKYRCGVFGCCPKVSCESQSTLPLGLSDKPLTALVTTYCPKCMDVYTPRSRRHRSTDGAYFGTGFPHMFFMVHPEFRPLPPTNLFTERLYGFKIHPLAYRVQEPPSTSGQPLQAIVEF